MTPTAEQHEAFLAAYHEYVLTVVNPLRLRVRAMIDEWRLQSYWAQYGESGIPIPSPVVSALVRVKRPEAVVDKVLRNPPRFPDGLTLKSVREMGDIVGARIIVPFLSDVALVANEIDQRKDLRRWQAKTPRVYIEARDESLAGLPMGGYERFAPERDTATVVYWLHFESDGEPAQVFQVQIVTLLQEAWSGVQRQLGYHRKSARPDVQEHFVQMGYRLREWERELATLRRELDQVQRSPELGDETPLSAENLPACLAAVGLRPAQHQLEGMLKVLASRGILNVGALRRRATSEVVATIKHTYIEDAAWAPEPFEIVATLAMLDESPTEEDVVQASRLNQQYLEQWVATARESATARDNPAAFAPRKGRLPRLPRSGG
jgi:ppGpp synthetase/RelA/SpoT-type nucleotidyltranferase